MIFIKLRIKENVWSSRPLKLFFTFCSTNKIKRNYNQSGVFEQIFIDFFFFFLINNVYYSIFSSPQLLLMLSMTEIYLFCCLKYDNHKFFFFWMRQLINFETDEESKDGCFYPKWFFLLKKWYRQLSFSQKENSSFF